MTKRRISILIPNLGLGGAQKVFRDQYRYLSKNSDVWACVFNSEGAFETDHEIRPISLNVSSGRNLVEKAYYFFSRCINYRKIKRRFGIEVSISHMEGANYVNLLSGGSAKVILVEHGSKVADIYNRHAAAGWLRRNVMMPIVYRLSDKVVAVSEGLKKELITQFHVPGERIEVIPNSFDIARIQKLADEAVSTEIEKIFRRPVIITSGRLHPQKNQLALLYVFSEIKKRESAPCLVILGDGGLFEELVNKAKQLDLKVGFFDRPVEDADVYFFGHQENPFKYLSKSTLFVFPSDFEGFPLALCEAMICGTPVISTDCRTGPREILAPDTNDKYEQLLDNEEAPFGVLMPMLKSQSSIECWEKVITQLLNDTQRLSKYSMAGRIRMTEFSSEVGMKKWLDLIE